MSSLQDYGKAANFARIDFEGRAKPLMVLGSSRQAFASVRVGIIRIRVKTLCSGGSAAVAWAACVVF